ncbi:MAG: PorV/PorQ family protein [Elusimicrobia bacterium]|nr:PorV/PorQ family protein [Elusimicrobiota bacterium]
MTASAASLDSVAAFLKIDPSARSAALGGAMSASAGSADSVFFNPAGLAKLARRELSAGHAEWLAGTRFDVLAFGAPTRYGSLGVSAVRLSVGSIEARATDRSRAGSFDASDAAYGVTMAKSFSGYSAGGTLKFLRSQIGPYSAQAVAVDLGARKELPGRPLSIGLAVRNLGQGMKFLEQEDALPLMVSAGASYRLAGVLGLALDIRHEPHDKRTSLALGTEYAFLGALSLRAGYAANSGNRSPSMGLLGGLGAGLGFRLKSFGADYSFTPFGDLGDAQRLSLSARF